MKNIGDFTTEELEAEIARRKSPKVTRPMVFVEPDFLAMCTYIDSLVANWAKYGEYDGDDSEYIFEEVMKTLYGPNFFEWFNKLKSYS